MGRVGVQKRADMRGDAHREGRERPQIGVVSSFEHAHKTSFAAPVSYLGELGRQPVVVELSDHGLSLLVQVVPLVGIETCRH